MPQFTNNCTFVQPLPGADLTYLFPFRGLKPTAALCELAKAPKWGVIFLNKRHLITYYYTVILYCHIILNSLSL